jgi:hypothetical protein
MTIADLACWPGTATFVLGTFYDAAEFLNVKEYTRCGLGRNDEQGKESIKKGEQDLGTRERSASRRHSAQDFKDLEERTKTKEE